MSAPAERPSLLQASALDANEGDADRSPVVLVIEGAAGHNQALSDALTEEALKIRSVGVDDDVFGAITSVGPNVILIDAFDVDSGIELCRAYQKQHGFRSVCLMPSNLYGPGDTFDAFQSHVLPALMMRFHEAKVRGQSEVVVFGTGTPRREFVYVDDVADAALVAMKHFENAEIVNVGLGYDVTIRELAAHIANVVGYRGSIVFDPKKPDGTPQKLLDVSRLAALGWRAKVSIGDGIERTYRWYVEHVAKP